MAISKLMLVLTGLFPNSQGNQSLLNSLRGYEKEYSIVLMTVANLTSDKYLSLATVADALPKTRIFALWPNVVHRISIFLALRQQLKKSETIAPRMDDGLINTGVGRATRLAFLMRSLLLAIAGVTAVLRYRPHTICIYEINGMLAARVIRWLFPRVYLFGKFQGTVLGANLHSDDFLALSRSRHPLDTGALRYVNALDGAIMTNDGTRGQDVLDKFGFSKTRVLFVPNGVDERFINAAMKHRQTPSVSQRAAELLHTLSVSRLIGWKRVDRVVEAMALLMEVGVRSVHHTIIGGGSDADEKYIRELIEHHSLLQMIDFKGGQSFENVIAALSRVDLLISVYKPTNATNPVFEALAMGVPVLTIREDALIEVLGERARGCFFIDEPGSEKLPEVLANTLKQIDHDAIRKKKKILEKLTPPSWVVRSRQELEFIRKGARE